MDKLFLEEVIGRYKYPHHRGQDKGRRLSAKNISCGDDVTLYLKIENDLIKSAKFNGELCSIANYGADLLCKKLIGQKIAYIAKITSCELLNGFGDELLKNPVRLKCFELAQMALQKI